MDAIRAPRGWLYAPPLFAMLAFSAPIKADSVFSPVSIECPSGANGTLKLISANEAGAKERLILTLDRGRPAKVVIEASENGGAFEVIFEGGLSSRPSSRPQNDGLRMTESDFVTINDNATAYAFLFYREVCLEPDRTLRQRNWLRLQKEKN